MPIKIAEDLLACAEAQQQLETGDPINAIASLKNWADKESPRALFLLGRLAEEGLNIPPSPQNMLAWYKQAADKGHKGAQYALGKIYRDGVKNVVQKDYQTAAEWFEQAAAQGEYGAAYELGKLYESGSGVRKNTKKALELIDHAAGCGYPEAQYYLGYLYQNGVGGIKQDYRLALHWYQKAAEKNHTFAQFLLAQMYEKGKGTKQDLKLAYFYYLGAAENSHGEAMLRMAKAYHYGNEAVFQNLVAAISWYAKGAIEVGSLEAAITLFELHRDNHQLIQAMMWLDLACCLSPVQRLQNQALDFCVQLSPFDVMRALDISKQLEFKLRMIWPNLYDAGPEFRQQLIARSIEVAIASAMDKSKKH